MEVFLIALIILSMIHLIKNTLAVIEAAQRLKVTIAEYRKLKEMTP